MVDVQEAREQLQQIRQQLEARRQEADQAKRQLEESRRQALNQQALRQASGGGIAGRLERQKALSELKKQSENVTLAKSKLNQIEAMEIDPYEAKINEVESAQQAYNQKVNDYDIARKVFYENLPVGVLETKQQIDFYYDLVNGKEASIQAAIRDIEEQASQSLDPKIRANLARELSETGKATLKLGSSIASNLKEINLGIPKINIDSLEPSIIPSQTQQSLIKFKDINWLSTIEGKRSKEGKQQVLAQDYLEQQLGKGFDFLSEKSLGLLPNSTLKNILGTPVNSRYTDIIKFSALPSTTTELLSKGVLTPRSQTSFIASVKQGGGVAQVNVISSTSAGRFNILGFGREYIKSGDKETLSLGRGFILNRINPSKTEVTEVLNLGLGKSLGKARIVKKVGGVELKADIGEGTIIKTLTRDIQKLVREPKIDLITGEISTSSKVTQLPAKTSKAEVYGFFSNLADDVYGFIGKTGKPTTRIYESGGITNILRNPNIKGIIFKSGSQDIGTSASSSVVKEITKSQRSSIESTIGALASRSEAEISKQIAKSSQKTIPNILDTILPSASATRVSSVTQTPKQSQKQNSLSILDIRSKNQLLPQANIQIQGLIQAAIPSERELSSLLQRQKQESIQKSKQRELIILAQPQISTQIQSSKQKQILRARNRQRSREAFIPESAPASQIKPQQPTGPKIDTTGGLLPRLKKRLEENQEVFEVFGKRQGEDLFLGKSKTKKGAEQILGSFLKGTLGRSGFLKKGREKIFSDLLRSPEFRKAKNDPFRVVQKRKFSLGSSSEREEIQFFKRKSQRAKNKKTKRLAWFT